LEELEQNCIEYFQMGVAIQCGTVAAILDNKHCIGSAGLGLPIVGNSIECFDNHYCD